MSREVPLLTCFVSSIVLPCSSVIKTKDVAMRANAAREARPNRPSCRRVVLAADTCRLPAGWKRSKDLEPQMNADERRCKRAAVGFLGEPRARRAEQPQLAFNHALRRSVSRNFIRVYPCSSVVPDFLQRSETIAASSFRSIDTTPIRPRARPQGSTVACDRRDGPWLSVWREPGGIGRAKPGHDGA